MLSAVLLLALAAQPTMKSVAVNDLTLIGLEPKLGVPLTEHLAQSLTGLKVITQKDIAAAIGAERQRQLMGCTDESSCLAELTSALGVDFLCLGEVTRLDSAIQVTLRLVDGASAKRIGSYTGRASNMDGLFDVIAEGAHALSAAVAPPTQTSVPRSGFMTTTRGIALLPLALGLGGLVTSGVLGGMAGAEVARLRGANDYLTLNDARARGAGLQTGAVVAALGGGAALAIGALLFVLGGPASPAGSVQVTLSPQGAAVAWAGAFP